MRGELPVVLRAGAEAGEDACSWLEQAGALTALFVPIVRASEGVGCLAFVQTTDRAFNEHDVEALRILSGRVGLALENARLYAEQHQVATVLQRDLLPPALPDWPGVELASMHRPARSAADVGGDFIDAFEAVGRQLLVVGDVSGKGVEAAATTALVRHAVRAAIRAGALGSQGLELVNRALVQDAPGEQFCTLAWAELRRDGKRLSARLAVAGHPPPLVVRAGGAIEITEARGTLLGFYEDISAHTVEIALDPGDALVLFTDGLTEARREDGSLFEMEGLCRALGDAAGIEGADDLLEAIEIALDREHATTRDDLAIVSVLVLE
jgi:serine phosphatase RsbU (regulator of sigma subunit)